MPYQWHRSFNIKWFESIAMFGKHKNTELAMANYPLPTCRQWGKSRQTSVGIGLFSRWNPCVLPVQAESIAIWITFLGNVFRTDIQRHAYSFYALNPNTKKYDFHNIWQIRTYQFLSEYWTCSGRTSKSIQNVTHFNNWFNQMLKTGSLKDSRSA
jgi:hypothetical protein